MAVHDSVTQVADGDQLDDGYFNEHGFFFVEATDDTGSDQTHSTGTLTKKRTFSFTGLSTNYQVVALELEDVTLADSSGNAADHGDLYVKIDDGTTHYSLNTPATSGFGGTTDSVLEFPHWEISNATFNAGNETAFFITTGTSTIKRISVPLAVGMMTGVTSFDVEFWLAATQVAANTVTLTQSWKVRLVVQKRPQDLGTTVTQA